MASISDAKADSPVFRAFLPGAPEPQGSAKGFPVRRRNGRIGVAITSDNDDLKAWREDAVGALLAAAEAAEMGELPFLPLTGAVSVVAEFIMPRLVSHPKTDKGKQPGDHKTKPDLDKLQRALGDALEQAGIVEQDSRISRWLGWKRYAAIGEEPGVDVTVRRAGEVR